MKRNRVLFYVLASLALVLCVCGVSRYHRNEASTISLPPQPITVNTAWPEVMEFEPYFHRDFIEAVTTARQQNKPILMLFTAKNCLYSKQILNTTFQSDILKPFLQRFVLINIDINEQKEICHRLNIDSTPTIQFISAEGVPLQRINGAAKPEDLIVHINSTLQTIAMHGRIVMR
ncbi:MAG: thioredoxin family protein [Planctomycetaceae bacterium]|nr:thioredoxin family protein [Planctomycetaceae bacterium]